MANLESIDTCTNSIESIITDETLDDLILNYIISICNNRKRPDSNSIFEYINRELKHFNSSGRTSYWIRAESEQDFALY